jgi:hypothetical protein
MADWDSVYILYRDPSICITDGGIVTVPSQLQNDDEPLKSGDRLLTSNMDAGLGLAVQRDLDIPYEE